MKRLFNRTTKKHKKGFSLMEAIISITIFAIMGTMFASFMISSVRVVNLTVATEREREMLVEAVAAAKVHGKDEVDADGNIQHGGSQYKDITINVIREENITKKPGSTESSLMEMHITATNTIIKELDDKKYIVYTAPSGLTYCIYIGEFPINIDESIGDGSVDKPGESETTPETGGGNAEGGTTKP